MATQPQTDDSIPRWFHEFALENAEQHRRLGEAIAAVENRLIRWIVGMVVGLAAIVIGSAVALALGIPQLIE